MAKQPAGTVQAQPDSATEPFVGRWHALVSTTNWEKGRIVCQWREALEAQGAAVAQYSDEAWATLVGGVTPQHVGRLRRVFQRFGDSFPQYPSLYWSHFQAAIEWSDAEMWLEGALQNDWSVSNMRRTRWETMGSIEAERPHDSEIVTAETDEDFVPPAAGTPGSADESSSSEIAAGPRLEGPDFGDEALPAGWHEGGPAAGVAAASGDLADTVRPFANLAPLPDDLAEPFEAFKLAMLRHKADDWRDVSCADVLAALDALKALALAPSE